jgi:exosortase K
MLYASCVALCAASFILFDGNMKYALMPHKAALEYLYGFDFVFVENSGYEQARGLFTITRSCMGVKLFINLFLIMTFGFLREYAGTVRKIKAIARFYVVSLILAYAITVMRIAASVPFCAWDRFYAIHNALSLVIYFASGLVLYFIMERRGVRIHG